MGNITSKKPPKAGAGRPKGSLNKTTKAVKDAITEAFDKAGGVAYLVNIAKEDPRTFCALLGKVIPVQVGGDPDSPMVIEVVVGGGDKADLQA